MSNFSLDLGAGTNAGMIGFTQQAQETLMPKHATPKPLPAPGPGTTLLLGPTKSWDASKGIALLYLPTLARTALPMAMALALGLDTTCQALEGHSFSSRGP